MTRTKTALLALLIAAAAIFATASPAAAGGNEVKGGGGKQAAALLACGTSTTFYQQVAGIAELHVTYNSCTGYNTARMNHIGASYNVYTYTSVSLVKVTRGGAWLESPHVNAGTFRQYAGPVSTYAPANCVRAEGVIRWPADGGTFRIDSGPVGCSGAPYQF